MADDAGALLVRSGLITAEALEQARALVQSEGGSLGEHLVIAGALTDDALTEFYRTRLLVPQVNPNTLARLPETVVSLIPAELAIELRVIPVSLGEGLTIAMGDPSSRVAVDEVSSVAGTYVIRSVATQMQIAWCLAHYYGHVTPLGQRLVQGGAAAAGEGAVAEVPASSPPRRARGLTSKVNAARHRALPPITSQIAVLRPEPGLLDDPTPVIEIHADEPDDDEPDVVVEPGAESDDDLPADPPPPAKPAVQSGARKAEGMIQSGDSGGSGKGAPLPTSRVRTLTGEIAIGGSKRKPTVRPDEPIDAPSVTIEVSEALMPKRRAVNWQDPPELASRAGEVQSRAAAPRSRQDEPAVVIADEAFDEEAEAKAKAMRLAQLNASVEVQVQEDVAIVTSQPARGAVAQLLDESDSAPILLQPKRPTLETPAAAPPRAATAKGVPQPVEPVDADEPSGAVVLLAQPKQSSRPSTASPVPTASSPRPSTASPVPSAPVLPAAPILPSAPVVPATAPKASPKTPPRQNRPERRTQLGLGIDAVRSAQLEQPSGRAARDTEVTVLPPELEAAAARYREGFDDEDTSVSVTAAADTDEPIAPLAEPPPPAAASAPVDRPAQRAAARALESSNVDDGWGPPGSTIPPPWLGAIPGGIDADAIPGMAIPISDESGPLLMAPPSPPQPASSRPSAKVAVPNTEDLVAELEIATGRVVELVRRLDQATDRDQIIDLLVNHLADSHHRAGFLTIRQAVLTPFRLSPSPGPALPTAQLKLDGPSTFQDVVDTQLPYRGPLADESSRQFVAAVLGEVPSEILLVPVAVRERAVGVLFADRRKRHTFDEQLTVAARAAGVAFERVVRARRER